MVFSLTRIPKSEMSFIQICMDRDVSDVKLAEKFEAAILVTSPPKLVWFNELNASPRDCAFYPPSC